VKDHIEENSFERQTKWITFSRVEREKYSGPWMSFGTSERRVWSLSPIAAVFFFFSIISFFEWQSPAFCLQMALPFAATTQPEKFGCFDELLESSDLVDLITDCFITPA